MILSAINCPPQFVSWIKECITTPRFSISMNGELVGLFKGKKGLRQGDPLSPYLFILVMDSLSRLLDRSASQGLFGLHPKCQNPFITHVTFADDLMVFSDGHGGSIQGILGVLRKFKGLSGLGLNASKSAMFLGGIAHSDAVLVAATASINLGTYPTRYLGLPLTTRKLSISDLNPLVDKIRAKLSSWTSKFLSYAGKIRLISSVIYGMVNFWTQVFVLPKSFFRKVDSLCASFLWKNLSSSAAGARVAWADICLPKEEGGLGIRLLEHFARVFRLKLIWLLFANAGSLWVAWVSRHVFRNKGFWGVRSTPVQSWTLRKLLDLREEAARLLKCRLGDGTKAMFWFDNWTPMGPLIDVFGDLGPRQLRIPKYSRVEAATRNSQWALPPGRSSEAEQLHGHLFSIPPPKSDRGADCFLWKVSADLYSPTFSSKHTWEMLRERGPVVPWAKVVWFKYAIPRFSFILWLALKDRLPTRDRLVRWRVTDQPVCALCKAFPESVIHLFFDCGFVRDIWDTFAGSIAQGIPNSLAPASKWILDHNLTPSVRVLLKLVTQVIVYSVWRERNRRIFMCVEETTESIKRAIDKTMRNRLVSISTRHPCPRSSTTQLPQASLLEFYFGCVRFL